LKANRDGSSSFTTAGTVQTNPPILSPVSHCARRNQNSKTDENDLPDLIRALNHLVASLGVRVVEALFPPETARLQRDRRIMLDPPLFGSDENYSFSTMQINISPLNKSDLSSLGSSGDSHVDRHDDPMSLTLIICMSYLKRSTDPGKFYIGETRDWCALQPFSLLIFRGTGPHAGTQAIPLGQPDGSEKRINLVLYPRKEFVNRTLDLLYPCYNSQQLADYSFFSDGGACFGTKEYHESWCSRELFRHLISGNKEYGRKVDDSALQQAFTAFTGSIRRYIDRDSPQGKEITKSVADANELMESLRPRLQKKKPQAKRLATIGAVPALPATSRGKSSISSQTTDSIEAEKQPSTVTSEAQSVRRSTRIKNLSSQSAVSTETTEPDATEKQPSTVASDAQSLRHPTRIENPQARMVTLSDNKTSSRKLRQPTSSCKKKISNDDIPQAHDEDGAVDVDDDSHEDDNHSTSEPPKTGQSTLEILQGHPLFQLAVMNSEFASIERKAQALPFKFTNRAPQLGAFQAKPSSHLLPVTDGLTIVERLIQLGERCHRVTQKSEHLWFYGRALDEHLISTLLIVEPLFDVDKLTHVFHNRYRNDGAGVCSSAFLNRVESIVNKMIVMAECSDDTENTELLDPAEILGEQYQPKFCTPVEVKLRPYAGKNHCKHMALHFREVSNLLSWKSDLVDCVSHVFCTAFAFVYPSRQ
jgi:hypothetical protein